MPQSSVQLKVTLRRVRPPVWRRVVVGSSVTLIELHSILQIAMGWTDSHLHAFDVDGVLYSNLEDVQGVPVGDESRTKLAALLRKGVERFDYEYDFGDGWEHDVLVEKVEPAARLIVPRCLAGRRACPPEDCGGPWGYERLLEVLRDPGHEEHAWLSEWVGGPFDPARFDLAEANDALTTVGPGFKAGG